MGTVVEKRKVKPDVFPYSCFIFICGGGEKRGHKNVTTLDPRGSALHSAKASAANPHLCLGSCGS